MASAGFLVQVEKKEMGGCSKQEGATELGIAIVPRTYKVDIVQRSNKSEKQKQ